MAENIFKWNFHSWFETKTEKNEHLEYGLEIRLVIKALLLTNMMAIVVSLFAQQMQGPSESLQCRSLRLTVDPKNLGQRGQTNCK